MDDHHALPVKRIGIVLLAVTLGLILVDQAMFNLRAGEKYDALLYIYFDVTREGNIPTFWNAALLLFVTAAAVLVAFLTPGRAVGWWIAAGLAFLMGMDETVQIHEHLNGLGNAIQATLGVTFPTFTWLIPGSVIALAGVALLWVWSGRQPTQTRRGLRWAVLLYASGVVVVEALGGMVWRATAGGSAYQAMAALEELLEMSGAIVAVLAILASLRVKQTPVRAIHAVTAASPSV